MKIRDIIHMKMMKNIQINFLKAIWICNGFLSLSVKNGRISPEKNKKRRKFKYAFCL
jgi:hypothetical protein